MAGFWEQYWYVVLFYVGVIFLLFLFRKKFEFQGGIIALLKTGWGVKWMNRFGTKHATAIQRVAHIGIYVGYAGMVIIIGFILYGLWQLIADPTAPATLTPLLPGVRIPGVEFQFPLFKTLIALFIVIVVHEGAHGIVSAAHKIKVKSSGLLAMGPIFGAFVEPDEEVIQKKPGKVQNAVYAAGPWSNILLAIVAWIIAFGLLFGVATMLTPTAVSYSGLEMNGSADRAQFPPAGTITGIGGEEISSFEALQTTLQSYDPGDTTTFIINGEEYFLTLEAGEDEGVYVGIVGLSQTYALEQERPWLYSVMTYITGAPSTRIDQQGIFWWVFLISLGLGLANLIPLGPVDGGRMYLVALERFMKKKRAEYIWKKTALVFLVAVILLIFVPILRTLASSFA